MIKSSGYLFLAALILAGCATPAARQPASPSPEARIKLSESMCYFKCASYEIEVAPNGHYRLDNIRDTKKDGITEGEFGPDAWAKAQAAFDAAHFSDMPENLTASPPGGLPCINDLPSAAITRRLSASEAKTVVYYQGCAFPAAGRLLMVLRETFHWAELVKPVGQ